MIFPVVFAIACLLSSGSAGSPQRKAPTPKYEAATSKWRVDVRPIIGSARTEWGLDHDGRRPRVSLWFIDAKTLVATLVTHESQDKRALADHNAPQGIPLLQLRAVFFDSATGKAIATRDWPTESRNAGIVAVHDGKFAVQAGNEVTLYASDLTVVKTLTLPPLAQSDWAAYASPTGRNILFSYATPDNDGSWIWVETDTLRIVRSWEEPRTGQVAITDDKIAMLACERVRGCEPYVEVRGLATQWETIAPGRDYPFPKFIDNSLLYLEGHFTSVILSDGAIIFAEDKPPDACWQNWVFPAVDGQRFAVPTCGVKGGNEILDIGGHTELKQIRLYDSLSQKCCRVLDVKAPNVREPTGFAISPDGLRLAILNDKFLEVVDLPPLQ